LSAQKEESIFNKNVKKFDGGGEKKKSFGKKLTSVRGGGVNEVEVQRGNRKSHKREKGVWSAGGGLPFF